MLSCRRSRSTRASWPTSAGRSSASARYSWVMRKRFSAVSVITSQRSTPIILPTSVTVACRKWSRLMTEKVSEPMRLRIASRASCILSLRSSERVSLIFLPCECYGGALAAVGIANFDSHRSVCGKFAFGNARLETCSIAALWITRVEAASHHYHHALLHTGAGHRQFFLVVRDFAQGRQGNVHLRRERTQRAQPPVSDDGLAPIIRAQGIPHLNARQYSLLS